MAHRTFQRSAALALAVLLLLPGLGFAQWASQAPLPLPDAAPAAARALADKAFVGSFAQLDEFPGASDLASLQPNLEAVLRYYALDRGAFLSPPRTPEVAPTDALAPALQALALATGKPLPDGELQKARELPAELQQALARIVLAYVEATRAYTEATAHLTRADLAALARGEPVASPPDPGRTASAALLLDRAIRESAPALRKWGLLLELDERTANPSLRSLSPDALLRAGAATQSLGDAVDLAAVLQGWQPADGRFEPRSQRPSEAMTRLYDGLGVPRFPTDRIAFRLLDTLDPARQALVIVLADAAAEAAATLLEADAVVGDAELAEAYAALAALDLEAVKAADPARLDTAPLQAIVEVLARADHALTLRLQAAARMADALALARDLAPAVAAAPPGFGHRTDSHSGVTLPPIAIESVPGAGGRCALGEMPSGQLYFQCGPLPNATATNVKFAQDPDNLAFVLYNDEDGDGAADENEYLLRTPAMADKANDVVFKDPYGFLQVGGNGRSVFDHRYGSVNVSIRTENGTIREERRLLEQSPPAPGAPPPGALLRETELLGRDLNETLFEPQDGDVVNFTMNPQNATLLSVDLGGDDRYTMRPGGASDRLLVYNSTWDDRIGRRVPCLFLGGGFVTVLPGHCLDPEDASQAGGLTGSQVLLSASTDDPGEGGATWLNLTNLSLPLRLGVALDTSGNDQYNSPFNFTMGAADRGVGLLWDLERCHRDAPVVLQGNCTAHVEGNDVYVAASYSLGFGYQRGVGFLLDERGNDVRTAVNASLGAAWNQRSIGLAVDLEGDDRYFGGNYTMGSGGREQWHNCPGTDNPTAPCGAHPQGNAQNALLQDPNSTAGRSGLGLLLDRRGNDAYGQVNLTANQGKGWPALGLLLDLAGDDRGLQTNLTARGPFGTVALGLQEQYLTAWGTGNVPEMSWVGYRGSGGGLVVDAEMPATDPAAYASPAAHGVAVGATEVEGDTNYVACGSPTTAPLAYLYGARRCLTQEGSKGSPGNDHEYLLLSRQKFLLRIPGAFGLGGVLSHDGLQAPVHGEEHLLQLDLGGDDVYRGPFAGASTPNLTRLDTEGQKGSSGSGQAPTPDEDVHMAPLWQAGLVAPVSVAIDVRGSDLYDGRTGVLGGARRNLTTPSLGGAWMGIGLLHDLGPAPVSGTFPLGAARPPGCDGPRLNDAYLGFNRSIGYGALYGIGAVVDAEGDDCYVTLGGDSGANATTTLSYSLGAGRLGGIGVLLDARGDDTYRSGNMSQGAGVLEATHDHLPRRAGVSGQPTSSTACVVFHDTQGVCTNLRDHFAGTAQAMGALVDGRGRDRYAFGAFAQGYGERRANATLQNEAGVPTLGTRNALAGLFVDDGFEPDTYANASYAPADHRDNAFWCSQPNAGPLNAAVAGSAAGLPRVDAPLPGQDGPLAQQRHLQRQADRATSAATHGPNPQAQCLRVELGAPTAKFVDLGTMGRGFDNLDFFANVLLALSKFGQEYVRARSVLSAPAVVDVGCIAEFNGTELPSDPDGSACDDLSGVARVDARVLWGPASMVYNAGQLLRAICGVATGDDAQCRSLLYTEGEGARPREACEQQLPRGVTVPRVDWPVPADEPLLQEKTYTCKDLVAVNPPIGLGLHYNATLADPVANRTSILEAQRAGSSSVLGNAVRRIEFFARPNRTDVDIPLGVLDRRANLTCLPTFQDCPLAAPRGNVSLPSADGFTRLRWDTTHVQAQADGNLTLRTPDGAYNLVIKAYFQPDGVAAAGAQDDQRYVLNRLGDEYGFYPGVTVKNVTLDNPPVVYKLEYQDISLAEGADPPPNSELRLKLNVSPRRGPDGAAFGLPYVVNATLVPLAEDRAGLANRTFACREADDEQLEDGDLAATRCWRVPGSLPAGVGGGQRIVAGWGEGDVRAALQDGRFLLQVDVIEPAHTGVGGKRFPDRGTARCFLLHGLALEPSLGQAWCNGTLAVDSVAPVTVARIDPSRLGDDQMRWVNRSVAFPLDLAIAQREPAVVPLRFDTLNAAQKLSPVLAYDVRARVFERPLGAGPDELPDGAVGPVISARFVGTDRGNLTIPVCQNTEGVTPEQHPCLQVKKPPPGALPEERVRSANESRSRFVVDVQVSARDLAGNADPFVLAEDGAPVPEATGGVDVDAPVAKLCQPQSTLKDGVPDGIPRIRTRNATLPMPWDPARPGCQGAILPEDNHGVEAVLIRYAVTDPTAVVDASDLTRAWRPPPAQQKARSALFDIAERGLAGELTNNRTLHFMAQAVDFAGNLQDRNLLPWKVTYDVRPPDLEVLELTADHRSITYRWLAKDREAGGKVTSAHVEWGTLNATTGLPELNRTTPAPVGATGARALLDGLAQDTRYFLRAVSADDVGNVAALPIVEVVTDPIVRMDIVSPRPGDVLTGDVPLRVNVSDVRVDPVVRYEVSLVIDTGNGTLVLPVENVTRRECIAPEADCPTPDTVIAMTRTIASAKFPDARETYLRVAANNSLNPGHPVVVSVGPLKVDNGPPLTRLDIVAQGGPEWFRTAALLVLEPLDNVTAVVHTEYSFDNLTFEAYNASAPPVQDKEGVVPFFFRSLDAAGNREETRRVDVKVDKQRPFGNVSLNAGARAANDPNVTVTLQVADGLSGVGNLTVDTGDGTPFELERPSRFAASPKAFPVQLPGGEGERRVRIRATDLAGNVQELKASILVDTSPPDIAQVRVERVAHTAASLSWRTSEPSATRVEYGPASAEVLANRFVTNATGLAHVVGLTGLRPSLAYQFRVVAEDELGNRATARGTFETLPDVTPPGAAHGLGATDLGHGAVRLAWEAAFDDVGIDHYVVLRGVAGQLDELGRATELTYIDDRGIPGVTYEYAVQAVDLAGQPGPLSGVVQARATTRPVLLAPAVSPETGTAATTYTYSVVVRDPDGDAPSSVRVRISGQAREMQPQFEGRADFAQGVPYALATRLPATTLTGGFPTYQFEAADARGVVQHPDVPVAGPAVLGPGAILPGLTAASTLFGLPGFDLALVAAAVVVGALGALRLRRGRGGR